MKTLEFLFVACLTMADMMKGSKGYPTPDDNVCSYGEMDTTCDYIDASLALTTVLSEVTSSYSIPHSNDNSDINYNNPRNVKQQLLNYKSSLLTIKDAFDSYSTTPSYSMEISVAEVKEAADAFPLYIDHLLEEIDVLIREISCDTDDDVTLPPIATLRARSLNTIFMNSNSVTTDLEEFLLFWRERSTFLDCRSSE